MDPRISIVSPRLDAKPWGGRRLTRYGIALPDVESIGEALVTAGDARVTSGYGAGQTLDEILIGDVATNGGQQAMTVTGGEPVFPLLVKLIDASENLSVQVHPDDTAAAQRGKLGKTEAWYVLTAKPGASLYIGLVDDVGLEDFEAAAAKLDGSSAALMRTVPAVAGQTVLIPAGTIHALGAGVIVYEVQQPSDITYRLDDWGRVDSQGNPREMHLEAGFAASRVALRPEMIEPVRLASGKGSRALLAACRYFALEQIDMEEDATVEVGREGSPSVVTLLEGSVVIGEAPLAAGQSAVVWASQPGVSLRAVAASAVLVSWVPDLEAEVVRPALAAGASRAAVAALAGETGDIVTNPPWT